MGIMPISTFVLAHFLIPAEPMTGRKLLGVSCGFFGLITLIGLSALGGIGDHLFGPGCRADWRTMLHRISNIRAPDDHHSRGYTWQPVLQSLPL